MNITDYIYTRINQLKNSYKTRVLLCLVDIENSTKPVQELSRLALLSQFTLILTWSNQEAARYLETYKSYEYKAPDIIRERPKEDFKGKLTDTLTSVKGVNKTDVVALVENFGNLKNIMNGSMEELSLCPGIGEKKVQRLYNAFHHPFRKSSPKKSTNSGAKDANASSNINSSNDEIKLGAEGKQEEKEEEEVKDEEGKDVKEEEEGALHNWKRKPKKVQNVDQDTVMEDTIE